MFINIQVQNINNHIIMLMRNMVSLLRAKIELSINKWD